MEIKEFIARRAAKEIKGMRLVNLGAGIPTKIIEYMDPEEGTIVHAENGIVGIGRNNPDIPFDPFRTDASENPITILPGGCIVESTVSFGIVRGGRLDATVLGTLQVDREGNIANWMVTGGRMHGAGGAMDLVAGAKRVIVTTEHCARDGSPKILDKCTYPLTGLKVVDTIITELAVFKVTSDGLLLTEIAPGITVDEVKAKTGTAVTVAADLCEIVV